MNATEELRKMLDECGIEYEQSRIEGIAEYTHVTKWRMRAGNTCTFYEIDDGCPPYFTRMFIETPTAAQAIAATVHDEASVHKTLIRESEARMALQRDYNNQITRIRNQRKQLREMQAALERGTCHTVSMDCFGNPPYNKSGLSGNDPACGCSECGAPWSTFGIFRGNMLKHNFKACPICGRRIVE